MLSCQDFAVPSKLVMQQWQAVKMSSEQTIRDLVRTRCPRAVACIGIVDSIRDKEAATLQEQQVYELMARLERMLGSFRTHPMVDKFLEDHRKQQQQPHFRARCLLLRGQSQSGKTRKANSLFGFGRTLSVNCQGLGTALPSLRAFSHEVYDAIVFDEISEEQVLHNKLVFQCGPVPVELSQSVCNQHMYKRWFYNCAMLLCSNTFRMSKADGLSDPADEDWLRANIFDARLEPGQRWYTTPGKCGNVDDLV